MFLNTIASEKSQKIDDLSTKTISWTIFCYALFAGETNKFNLKDYSLR